MSPREQAEELREQVKREEQGSLYRWHPDDSRVGSRYYPQACQPDSIGRGRHRDLALTEGRKAAIRRRVRAIRCGGTRAVDGLRMDIKDLCESVGLSRVGGVRTSVLKYLREIEATDVLCDWKWDV